MSQSRRMSLAEAVVNTLVGLTVAFVAQSAIAYVAHIPLTARDTLILTVGMTFVSVARSYVIRRLWNSEFWKRSSK